MADNDHVVMVVGPPNYRSYFHFARALDRILRRMAKPDITIISGSSGGTDYLTFIYALRRGLLHVMYEPKRLDFEAGVYRMQERMLEETTHLITVRGDYDKYVAQAARVAGDKTPRRVITIPPEQRNAKESQEGDGRLRKLDKRALSKYRQRRVNQEIPRWDDGR